MTEQLTVLLVEDNAAVRMLCRRLLERAGYDVIAAEDGDAALALAPADSGRLDLLVTDIALARLSGTALYGKLKESRPRLRVVYMTGYDDAELARRGWLPAYSMVLRKPFLSTEFVERVEQALRI